MVQRSRTDWKAERHSEIVWWVIVCGTLMIICGSCALGLVKVM
jgi:hypothetical protein